MDIAIMVVIGIIAWLILLFLAYAMTVILIYVSQELNHSIKNAKRYIIQSIWELEWKWKHR